MDVRLPNLGEGADSGVVVSIHVKVGDVVAKGQTLLELESGKAVAPIPAPVAGKVASVRVKEGEKITAGTVIFQFEGAGAPAAGATPAAPLKKAAAAAKAQEPEPNVVEEADTTESGEAEENADLLEDGTPAAASPELRRIARLLGIPLRKVRGSGHGGRITFDDARGYIARLRRQAGLPKTASANAAASAPAPERIDFAQFGKVTTRPLTPLRKVISQRMLESWTQIPQVTQFDEVDISTLLELRKKHVAAFESKGARLTVTGIVLRALVATLQKHPLFNASIDDHAQQVVLKEYIHLGIAVDTEAGLLVPVIRDAQSKNVLQLSRDLQSLAEKARDRKVSLEELRGGSFTVSNQGGIGGGYFTPIINRPEVAILGMGKASLKPVVKDKQIVPRTVMPLALSYDHRLIDGGSAARFIADLAAAIENFSEKELAV
ncbi:MAG: 2-oxo acid dehydrogenase subunit E2 [Verrucomicrobia bacterium]|nr:2-oxo acid dehydrogenase subunit E2 [Verrucomicrobiota bacterium]